MAQIDASIPLGVRPAQFESPANALAKILQVQGLQQEQQLGRMKMQEYERGVQEQNRLADMYRSGADSNALRRAGFGKQALEWDEKAAKIGQDKAQTKKHEVDAEKSTLETNIQKISLGAQILSTARDQASYDQARATAQASGLDVSRMPPQFDPAFVQGKLQESQSIKDQLEQVWKQKGYDLQVRQADETGRHNRTSEGLTAQGQQITMRGQNMTDNRARDFNATKVEENNIKREEKKATADLTKNSQIASFDTMLGTLDRLSAHPGLKRSVGIVGALPTIPGTDSANFQAELNTFQSQAFLPMVAQLKGMGALSDAEGKKLTAAVGALDPKMGEKAFRESVQRITDDMEAARERMAGQRRNPKAAPAGGATGGWSIQKVN